MYALPGRSSGLLDLDESCLVYISSKWSQAHIFYGSESVPSTGRVQRTVAILSLRDRSGSAKEPLCLSDLLASGDVVGAVFDMPLRFLATSPDSLAGSNTKRDSLD